MKERKFAITNFAVDNKLTIYFVTVLLIISGIVAYQSTPKEAFPEVVFPYFSVMTIYPGTSPEDIENLVTRPLEKQLKSINGIKEISSNSLQDYSLIFIEFETNINNMEANQDVKDAVDKARADLPADILDDPEVTSIDVSEFPVLYINLSGDLSLVKKKEYAEDLQDEIEGMEEITRVDIVGALEREFQINVDIYKMEAAGISFQEIEQKVVMENMTISAGLAEMGRMKRSMRIVGEFKTADDIANLLIRDGIYLKDIAEVKDGFADRESYSRLFGEDVITLNVIKKSGKNLIHAIEKIKLILAEKENVYPANLTITTTGDQSVMTRNNVSNLFNTIILGFIIVVIVLMFFMGVDNALFVAVSIPLSMVIAFIFIPLIGFTMNMVVLMAFILVLGIVVDNSIVVVENIYRHFMFTPDMPIAGAAKKGTAEVAGPVFVGTITTIAPFLPLAFWPGIVGKFMMFIPVTLIITLLASILVAYLMNPVFAVSFMKYRGDKKVSSRERNMEILKTSLLFVAAALAFYLMKVMWATHLVVFLLAIYLLIKYVTIPLTQAFQRSFLPWMMRMYRSALDVVLKGKRSWVIIGSTVFLLFFAFYLMGIFSPKVVFFPSGDPNEIYVYIKMPAGTHIETTDSVTRIVEEKVFKVIGKDNNDVESVISNVAMNAGESVFERSTQERLGKVTITFEEYKDRDMPHTNNYLVALREEMKDIVGAEITVDVEPMGPPVGKPINIEISGEHFSELIPIVDSVEHYINELNIPGIEHLKRDIETRSPELLVNVDRDKAARLGLSSAYIGSVLRTALYGKEISTIREGDDEYDIRLRAKENYRLNVEHLLNMKMALPDHNGGLNKIPISSVVDVEYSSALGGVIRKDYERVVTLSSNVLSGYNGNEIVERLKEELSDFQLKEGYEINFTGEQEDQQENSSFLMIAFLAAVALIFLILVMQFNSVVKPLIILVQIIFSMIGVFLGNIFFNLDFSVIMTGMGVIAVGGIVVKNAIILIDYTDVLVAEGSDKREAIIQAGATRLTPVLLTAASTILGLLPLAIGMNINFVTLFTELDPQVYFGGDNAIFWKPLAWTIIFGLTFATFLTLVVVPAMYSIMCKVKKQCD